VLVHWQEPVAALLAADAAGALGKDHGFQKPWLVVDIGGLSSDASVIGFSSERGLEVKANEVGLDAYRKSVWLSFHRESLFTACSQSGRESVLSGIDCVGCLR
jgi:hypothetical protein